MKLLNRVADDIVALINSKSRSPTRDEIIATVRAAGLATLADFEAECMPPLYHVGPSCGNASCHICPSVAVPGAHIHSITTIHGHPWHEPGLSPGAPMPMPYPTISPIKDGHPVPTGRPIPGVAVARSPTIRPCPRDPDGRHRWVNHLINEDHWSCLCGTHVTALEMLQNSP